MRGIPSRGCRPAELASRLGAAELASRLDAAELASRLDAHQVQVIDGREPVEYASGHIGGSRNVPLGRLGQIPLPAGPLVLVCQSGRRSARGLELLRAAGHPFPISDLEGGCPVGSRRDSLSNATATPRCP